MTNDRSLSTRLGELFSTQSRTPSPTPPADSSSSDMPPRSVVPLVSSASRARPLHVQPSVDGSPLSPSTSVQPRSPVRLDAKIDAGDPNSEEAALRTAAALRDAIEGDLELPFDIRQSDPNTYSFHTQRPPSVRLSRSVLAPPLRPPPLLNLARQTTSASTSLPLPLPPSDPATDDAHYTGVISSPLILHSPQALPTRSSLDTLRSIQSREMHTSASSSTRASLPNNWWFQNKAEVDPLLNERDRDDGTESAEDKLRKRYRAPKEPVVLAHGLLGFDSVSVATIGISYWRGIREALEAIGCEVLIAKVPATSSIEDRAKVLNEIISENLPGRKVHLIGHSMGGLDSRYLVSHLRSDLFTPISVTTIATPHRGSSFADHFLTTLGRERMPSFLSLLDLLPNGGGDGKAFESLTIDSMKKFNEQTPDAKDVQYFSWGASVTPSLIDPFRWPHSVILEKEGENDGLVSVESAKWGTYEGTLQGVNHLDLVGWVNGARYAWADWTGRGIEFKPATFYLQVVDNLAAKVEGAPELDSKRTEPEEAKKSSPTENTKDTKHATTGDTTDNVNSSL